MTADIEKARRRRPAAEAGGGWRAARRADIAPWFDGFLLGFDCGDGGPHIGRDLTEEIARLVGGPARYPRLRVTQVKQKYGTLRFYLLATPRAQRAALDAAIARAAAQSARRRETSGAPGRLCRSPGGGEHSASARHV